MDLQQRKLTRDEWCSIEIPVSSDERYVIDLITKGYHKLDIHKNRTKSLLAFLKIPGSPIIADYVFSHYLLPYFQEYSLKYGFVFKKYKQGKNKIKKADKIRISNTDRHLDENKQSLFEFVVLELLEKLLQLKKKNKRYHKEYYTLTVLMEYNIDGLNPHFKEIVVAYLATCNDITPSEIVYQSSSIIEKNKYLLTYADDTLYEHQRRLFAICKQPTPKLVLYIAPTGTGKTISPLGLSEGSKIIFVCAARHVGLALAKAAITVEKKVAFAFGCQSADDIRLHYFSAIDYIKHRKSGSIIKVDNSMGNNVEIMVCDIKSYIYAMYYMLAFNKKEDIIMYWDEPTITMDYETHECHDIIKNIWCENKIPNVVLSSATLPQKEEIMNTIMDFKTRFDGDDYSILSYDCKKSISLINKEGFVEMPHYMFDEHEKVCRVVNHCNKQKTLLRYLDLEEVVKCIKVCNNHLRHSVFKVENYFNDIKEINMLSIKLYYLQMLKNVKQGQWSSIHATLTNDRVKKMDSNVYVSGKDANTLTDGPTIFLADDVTKISRFCLQDANIPKQMLSTMMTKIGNNTKLIDKIAVLEKEYEDGTKKDNDKEKKMGDGRVSDVMKTVLKKIEDLKQQIDTISLNPYYVPNKKEHLERFVDDGADKNCFTSDISDDIVEKIMMIDDVEDIWKVLLLMGIGVFTNHKNIKYMEIMKLLAQQQKLYLIVASSDFIYGTNYQFCHGYVGKDLESMSQEKCIQAMGRVGRNKLQQEYTVRFRDNRLIYRLFQEQGNKPEVFNMARLFTTK